MSISAPFIQVMARIRIVREAAGHQATNGFGSVAGVMVSPDKPHNELADEYYRIGVRSPMPAVDGGIALTFPRESLPDLLRRWWRGRGRHRGLRYWMIFRGGPLLAVCTVLYAANGLVIGWRVSYDVLLAITSPAATSCPILAWALSILGWLIGPAVAGAVAGHIITASINARRVLPVGQLFGKDGDRA